MLTVFPKVDGPSGRGLRQPPGLSPLGCQGSACERLRLTGSLRACRPRELYSIAPLGRYGALRRPFVCRLSAAKTFTTGLCPMEMHPYSRCAGLPPEGEVCFMLSYGAMWHIA